MTTIIASILTAFILCGTAIPMFANKTTENSLNKVFNNPQKTEVRVYSTPSYKMLFGNFDRIEINLEKAKFEKLGFESVKIITYPIKIDYSRLPSKNLSFIKDGKFEVMIILTSQNVNEFVDINAITVKINKILSNIKIPIPFLSGDIFVGNAGISFEEDKPALKGDLMTFGGLVSVPFNFSGNLQVTDKNTIDVYEPQVSVSGQDLILKQVQELIQNVNPIVNINDIEKINNDNIKFELKKLYFSEKKLKAIGIVTLQNP